MGKRGSHRNDTAEEEAIARLTILIDSGDANRDSLPGSVMKKLKEARTIMKKRRNRNVK